MSFLIVSEGGDGLGLALRLKSEGHEVSMWIRDADAEKRGDGLVDKGRTPSGGEYITMLSDCTGLGVLLDSYKQSGGLVYGGSQLQDRLEEDRRFSSSVFKAYGIVEPKAQEFTDWESAIEFVKNFDEKLVFKPEGKYSGNLPSYVSHNSSDMLYMLDVFKSIVGEHEPEFILQEFIKGTCISSEAWVSQGKILLPTNHTLERKQLMPGDLGPSGGCTGNVVWRCDEGGDCPLCSQLLKLSSFFEEHRYTGCIDINSVVSTDGEIYALEFTPRFGYDAFPTLLYGLFEGNFGEFIYDNCRGSDGELPLKDGYAAGIRISIPPWPSEEFHSKGGRRIGGLSESNFDRFYPYEVCLQDDQATTSAGYGIIGVTIGYSESSIEEAFEDAYSFCRKLKLADMQYRNDLAEIFKSDLTKLRRSLEVKV